MLSGIYDDLELHIGDIRHIRYAYRYGNLRRFSFYGLLAVALIKMKRKGLIKVKVIGYPVIPVIIILVSIALIINTVMVHPKQSLIGLGLVLSGVPFYYYFKKWEQSNRNK